MKKRREAFFGMHFDFHAKPDQKNIGEFCDYETIDRLLREVKPDYIQCDTKGHYGISSYPTKVGTPAPEMKGDILKMWRELTKKHGVSLYAHHSGVLDAQAIVEHPEWAAVMIDGTPYKTETSVFSPYADERLIPQLIELATVYELDGAWVDGECWGTVEDYSVWAKAAYKAETGLEAPVEDDFDGREKYRDFCRRGFLKYVAHYCDEVHKAAPDFEIASNWLYTAYAIAEKNADVDFISGDYSPANSISTAIFEGRAMQNSHSPWDLMCWGFTSRPYVTKEYEQLCAEAGAVIMLGGGFQIYNTQMVGTVRADYIPMWAKLAEFCREREEVCHKATPYHEGAVLLSSRGIYTHKLNLFRWDSETNHYGSDTHGILFALIDAGYSTEILTSPQFDEMADGELAEYKFIAIADLDVIEENILERLDKYVQNGGNVIVCGVHSTKLFEDRLGVKTGDITDGGEMSFSINGKSGVLTSEKVTVEPCGAEVKAKYRNSYGEAGEGSSVFVTVNRCGVGHWIGIYANYGSYQHGRTAGAREMIGKIVESVCGRKIVEIDGTHMAQVVLTEKNGSLNVNLLNVSGRHTDARFLNYDEVVPLRDVRVSVEYPTVPNSVTLMPGGEKINFSYVDGRIELLLDRVDIHSVIVIK